MKYVVGYSPTERGVDALNLGVALARSLGAELDVVYVIKSADPRIAAPNSNFSQMLQQQAVGWLEEAQQFVPAELTARFHVRQATSTAQGLMEMAEATNAGLIIVGGAKTGGFRWHSLGAAGNALLHRSSCPVALAPRDYPAQARIDSIDCAVSPEFDSIGLVEEAIATENRTGLSVRLVSLLEGDSGEMSAEACKNSIQDLVAQSSVRPASASRLSIVVGEGSTVPDAVESVEWHEHSLLMAGSSKLAQRGELFLSSNTAKIMTKLPIPLIVVPRDYHPGRYGSQQQPWTGSLKIIDS